MNWKKLFVNDADKEQSTSPAPSKKATEKVTAKPPQAPTSVSSSPPTTSIMGSVPRVESTISTNPISTSDKEKYAQYLNQIYEKANFPGPDFQEYMMALDKVKSAAMDERTKFTTIYAGFEAQGVTKQRLIDTGNEYIKLIGEQVTGFNAEAEHIMTTEIGEKKRLADQLDHENNEIEKKMQMLTEQKIKNSEQMNKILSEINERTSSLNIEKSSFEAAANSFAASISACLDKIIQYL
jgi:small-conductance mechanosensitive channel